jgi:hypothetical protein
MSEYTPGPWTMKYDASPEGGEYFHGIVDAKGRKIVAQGLALAIGGFDGEPMANARLIAAAPDLLAAAMALEKAETERNDDCEECGGEGEPEACGTCFPPFDDARVMRRAAIAKATGAA